MKHRKLSDFIKPSQPLNLTAPPLYSDAQTGQVIIADKARDETPVLPELKTGNILRHRNGSLYRVYRVNNPKEGLYIEPLYRLEKIDTIRIKGHGLFSLEELAAQGMKIEAQ